VLLSDFVFLSHLSLYGTFLQVPEVLWYRDLRRVTGSSPRRQRTALFAQPPPRTYLPVSTQHGLWLFERLVLRRQRPEGMGRWQALWVPLYYQADWGRRLALRARKIVRKRSSKFRQRARKALVPMKQASRSSTLTRRLLMAPLRRRVAKPPKP
jgi:hypothetical protein